MKATRELTAGVIRVPTLDEIIASDQLIPSFQPIVDLQQMNRVHGYEALARLRSASPMIDPAFLFEYARRKNSSSELDLACLERSLQFGAALSRKAFLFVNVHPSSLDGSSRLVHRIAAAVESHDVDPARLVLEITEQESIERPDQVAPVLATLRSMGVGYALDDVGIAFSHLALIDRIQPAYLKVSQVFGTGFEQDETKRKIVRNIAGLASDFGAELILEGIETEETADAAVAAGIRYGQGYYFSRPRDAAEFLAD